MLTAELRWSEGSGRKLKDASCSIPSVLAKHGNSDKLGMGRLRTAAGALLAWKNHLNTDQ
jgi:hypothetical protein